MDPKLRANFINSVNSNAGEEQPADNAAGTENTAANATAATMPAAAPVMPAAAPVMPAAAPVMPASEPDKSIEKMVTKDQLDQGVTDTFVFAQGLPSWNLEPPMVAIRRRTHL